jgi:urease accessory protein
MARGEEWEFERYYSRNEVFGEGKRLARDAMLLEQTTDDGNKHGLPPRKLKDRLAPYACYATLLLIGPRTRPIITSLQSIYNRISQRQRSEPEQLVWSLSPLTDASVGVCVRVAGTETEMVRDWLRTSLEGLGAVVGEDVYNKAFV